jgi:hypothetical protein
MKRIFAVICILLVFVSLSACRSDWQADVTSAPQTESPSPAAPTATPEPTVVPDDGSGPNVIGLYVKDRENGVRRLVRGSFISSWQEQQDIECFEAFASQSDTVSLGRYQTVWEPYWEVFSDSSSYKVGYELKLIYKSGEEDSRMILGPEDTHQFWNCVEVYIYDDVNQPEGQWYSHLTEGDMQENTLCSSIKLTPGADIDQVEAMKLTVFTYRSQADFNSDNGSYLGFNSYSIDIVRA